jgi:EthD domain
MPLVVLGFYKRRPDLTHEDYIAYWRDVHGPLLRDTAEIRRYLARYVQHDLRPNTAQDHVGALDFDGMSEVWYHEGADRAALLAEPFFQQRIVPDEANFIDMTATRFSAYSAPVIQFS